MNCLICGSGRIIARPTVLLGFQTSHSRNGDGGKKRIVFEITHL